VSEEQTSNISINITVYCDIDMEKLSLLKELLNELVPVTIRHTYLKQIFIVADDALVDTVNAIIEARADYKRPYVAGEFAPSGVAVPIQNNDQFECYIVITESEVQIIKPPLNHPAKLVSTLLEELLHTQVYATVWEARGYIDPRIETSSIFDDLFVQASRFHDEYFVNRSKAYIAYNTYIFDVPGGYSNMCLEYGVPLNSIIKESISKLVQLRTDVTKGNITREQTWYDLIEIIYRYIFEPLARDAAYRESNPEVRVNNDDLIENLFYREYIEPYWKRIKIELERSYDSDLSEMSLALDEIVRNLQEFLINIGVTFADRNGQKEYIKFNLVISS